MNLLEKITKTHLLLLFMTLCFLAALLSLYLAASSAAEGTDYTISVTHRDTEIGDELKTELININTAAPEELETLPGIGPVTARRIVEYREKHGAFEKLEDLLNVAGIGSSTLEQLRDYAAVSD